MTKRAEKRLKQKKKAMSEQSQSQATSHASSETPTHTAEPKAHIKNPFLRFYNNNYKILLVIPMLIFLLAVGQIWYQASTNDGDFINKDISLRGGITLTIPTAEAIDINDMQAYLSEQGFDTQVRNIESRGRTIAFLIESDIDLNDQEKTDELLATVKEKVPYEEYSLEGIGANIGESFFKQATIALLFSFILMAIIVAIAFRSFIPSVAVIAAALSDIIVSMAIVNLLGIKVSTAGLAAFLMLIGYSVDTNILLTTRVLKREEGTVLDRIGSAFKTGIMMSATTLVAISITLFISSSEVIIQIMTILFIGILVDQVNTWLQNTGILRLYIAHKKKNTQ